MAQYRRWIATRRLAGRHSYRLRLRAAPSLVLDRPGRAVIPKGALGMSTRAELREVELHGHVVAYRSAGSGPAIVLVHGITSTSETWERVMPALAKRFTVIAPDLLGHGGTAKPRGDYSLGAYASGVRDLLVTLGHERATFVGHSLGGGVAMQLASQFPERCERLVLIDSGGLGSEVNMLLRSATLPGAEFVLPLLASQPLLHAGRGLGHVFGRLGLRLHTDLAEMARGHASLAEPAARAAFVHTRRTIVDPTGQRVNATDRLYLAEEVPFLIVWGARDRIIPAAHAHIAHERVPSSRLEIFEDAGHFPHVDEPQRFIEALTDFMDTTEPAELAPERWREMLMKGGAPVPS
jgi:pimeloyl-ACP methyl ester carboxylesterase